MVMHVVPSIGTGVVVIPLLGFKTSCAEKSTAKYLIFAYICQFAASGIQKSQ